MIDARVALAGDDLVADFFGGFAGGGVGQAFKGEFFGGACAAAGDDVAVYHNAVGKELLAVQFHFAAREASTLAGLEETCLGKNQRGGADGENPLAFGIKVAQDVGNGCGSLQVLNAGAATGEADCIEVGEASCGSCHHVFQENVCLDGQTMGAYNFQAIADGSQSHIQAATLPVVKRSNEFGFFKTVSHQEKNVHKYLVVCGFHLEGAEDHAFLRFVGVESNFFTI